MPADIPGFTADQHDKLGRELQVMRDKMTTIIDELGKVYQRETMEVASRVLAALDNLRFHMDNQICREHPCTPDLEPTQVYYRPNRIDYQRPEFDLAPESQNQAHTPSCLRRKG